MKRGTNPEEISRALTSLLSKLPLSVSIRKWTQCHT